MAKETESPAAARSWLLAGLIVAATAGAFAMLDRRKDASEEPGAVGKAAGADLVEAAPLAPHGEIVDASWRNDARAAAPRPDSILEAHDAVKSDRELAYEESLAATGEHLDGLAVYVAPAPGKDEKQKKEGGR